MAVENAALAVTSAVKIKKKAATFSKKLSTKEGIEVSPEEDVGKLLAYLQHFYCEIV